VYAVLDLRLALDLHFGWPLAVEGGNEINLSCMDQR
jgi:hypothetical protein